jgi:hypothetical protein
MTPPQQKKSAGSEELEVENGEIPKTPALEILEATIGTGIEREGGQQLLTWICPNLKSDNQKGYFFTRIKTPRAGRIAHIG